MRLAFVVLLVACGTPPVRKTPPKELPADSLRDVAGRWVTSDDMDIGYAMTIDDKGGIDVWIDRGKMGRCEQKGTIAPAGSRTFRVVYQIGECVPQSVGVPLDMKVPSFTGDNLTVVVGEQSRTYQRAPEATNDRSGSSVQLQ
jgi:hypothetical protein